MVRILSERQSGLSVSMSSRNCENRYSYQAKMVTARAGMCTRPYLHTSFEIGARRWVNSAIASRSRSENRRSVPDSDTTERGSGQATTLNASSSRSPSPLGLSWSRRCASTLVVKLPLLSFIRLMALFEVGVSAASPPKLVQCTNVVFQVA